MFGIVYDYIWPAQPEIDGGFTSLETWLSLVVLLIAAIIIYNKIKD
jgi:hypothetical protein